MATLKIDLISKTDACRAKKLNFDPVRYKEGLSAKLRTFFKFQISCQNMAILIIMLYLGNGPTPLPLWFSHAFTSKTSMHILNLPANSLSLSLSLSLSPSLSLSLSLFFFGCVIPLVNKISEDFFLGSLLNFLDGKGP